MTTLDLAPPRRALAIGAHPDDIEFGCGATLAKWADAGTDVTLCVLHRRLQGHLGSRADPHELLVVRETEQRAAAAVLGAQAVELLGYVDGELDHGLGARAAVCAVIRRTRPDVVFGTIRGRSVASIPITATPDCSPSKASSPRAIRTSSPSRGWRRTDRA